MKQLLLAILFTSIVTAAYAREQIFIVGSSTVFPFSTYVAELYGKSYDRKTPLIESTGTGGGMKLFCKGVGVMTPDIANASRPIKDSEVENCKNNGVTPIEYQIGYDGIVFGNSIHADRLSITTHELKLALVKMVDGRLNPYTKWSDINSELPDVRIEVYGPPPTSGTRDAFSEIIMEKEPIREDGVFVEAGENDNLIIKKLDANPNAFGIFGFSFLDNSTDMIQGSLMNGYEPDMDTISDGTYPLSRSLFMYVKKEHFDTIPNLKEFVDYFMSDDMIGEDGATTDKGLIPLL